MKTRRGEGSSVAVVASIILLALSWCAYAQEPAASLLIRIGTSDGERIAKIEGNKLWLSKTEKDIDQQPPLVAKPGKFTIGLKEPVESLIWDSWVFTPAVLPQSKEASAGVTATEIEIRRYHRSDHWPEIIACYHRWKIPGTTGNTWLYEKQETHEVKPDLAFPYHAPSSLKLVSCHFRSNAAPEFFVH